MPRIYAECPETGQVSVTRATMSQKRFARFEGQIVYYCRLCRSIHGPSKPDLGLEGVVEATNLLSRKNQDRTSPKARRIKVGSRMTSRSISDRKTMAASLGVVVRRAPGRRLADGAAEIEHHGRWLWRDTRSCEEPEARLRGRSAPSHFEPSSSSAIACQPKGYVRDGNWRFGRSNLQTIRDIGWERGTICSSRRSVGANWRVGAFAGGGTPGAVPDR